MNATLAEQFLEMANKMAHSMAPRGKEEEYVCAAYHGIAWALENLERRMVNSNLKSWVRANIYRFIMKHRMRDHLIRIPAETARMAKLRGVPIQIPQIEELSDIAVNPSYENEVLELLLKSASDPEDQAIIEMRIEGYLDPEIAKKLSRPVSFVHRRRLTIKIRFEALQRDLD